MFLKLQVHDKPNIFRKKKTKILNLPCIQFLYTHQILKRKLVEDSRPRARIFFRQLITLPLTIT